MIAIAVFMALEHLLLTTLAVGKVVLEQTLEHRASHAREVCVSPYSRRRAAKGRLPVMVWLAVLGILLARGAMAGPESRMGLARYTRVLGVTLELSTLRDVIALLGSAEIRHNGGDAAGSMYSICYRGSDGTTLVFNSLSEMGGPTHDVTGFQLIARSDLADYSGERNNQVSEDRKPVCSPSRRVSRSLALGRQLRLGTSFHVAAKALGVTTHGRVPRMSAQSTSPAGGGFETLRTVEIEFENERAVAIRVYQVTSN